MKGTVFLLRTKIVTIVLNIVSSESQLLMKWKTVRGKQNWRVDRKLSQSICTLHYLLPQSRLEIQYISNYGILFYYIIVYLKI